MPSAFGSPFSEMSEKEAYQQIMTAQLVLWEAKLERQKRRAERRRKQQEKALALTRRKLDDTWQTLHQLRESDNERTHPLFSRVETSILGLRRLMECNVRIQT